MTQPATEPTPRDLVEAWAAANGVTMTATFVPFSRSRNAKPREDGKPWPSLNWRVALAKGGRMFLETDYSAGTAHAPGSKAPKSALVFSGLSESAARADLIAWEIESGYPGQWARWNAGGLHRKAKASPILPDLPDVLYSLSSDAGVIDAGGFEEWASEFGYDTDSRKAEAIYRACLETALKMRAALGDDAMDALANACQDF